jgi:hypothetical protein
VLLSVRKSSPMPNLPFYKLREGPRVHKREKERKKKEKTEEKRALGLCHPSPSQAGPAVDNEGVRTSRPRSSPVL